MVGMRPSFAQDTVDQRIASVAGSQYGLVTRAQLTDAGLSGGAIGRRTAAGRLHRLHQGVYAVGHTAARREAQWLAAVLACGDGAVLSHRSAAALWQLADDRGAQPHVTVPSRNGRRRPAMTVHRGALALADQRVVAGIPLTSPARTLADLSCSASDERFTRLVREAQFRRILDPQAVSELISRRPCRRLSALVSEAAVTQTELEDRLLSICDRFAIPRPLTQHRLHGRWLDFAWPQRRVVVETDGWQSHSTRAVFQADRTISNALQLDGWVVLRFTHEDLTKRPAVAARLIARALDAPARAAVGAGRQRDATLGAE